MIKNERQYRITKSQAAKFAHALEGMTDESDETLEIHPLIRKAQEDALRSQLTELRQQLEEYESLQSGSYTIPDLQTIEDLPRVLIQARIGRGLSQKGLAERLGVKEQQIQRYEATDYASASLARVMEVIEALSLKVNHDVIPENLETSVETLFMRLRQVGLDRGLITKRLLPGSLVSDLQENRNREVTEKLGLQAAASIGRIFGWTLAEIFGSSSLQLNTEILGGVRFKTASRINESRMNAYTMYAHYLALLTLDATSAIPSKTIPTDAGEFRQEVSSAYGTVTFEHVLRYVWGLGISVVPLSDPGAFHGACWRIDGRNVIVLKQNTRSLSRWLYDLLHEIDHAGKEPDKREFNWIDEEDMSLERRKTPEELAANQFAGDVMLDGRADELVQLCVEAAGNVERLKSTVPLVAVREGVSVDALANHMAYNLSLRNNINWWGTATNLQDVSEDPWGIARDIFLENVPLHNINELDRNLLIQALADGDVQ